MDYKLLLIKAIALLFRESQLKEKSENSAELVRKLIKAVVVPEIIIGVSQEREVLSALKKIAMEMAENPVTHQYDKDSLLLSMRHACHGDDGLYSGAEQVLNKDLDQPAIELAVINLQKNISAHFRNQEVDALLNKAAFSFRQERDSITNTRQWISELVSKLEPYQVNVESKDPAINAMLNLADLHASAEIIRQIQEQENGTAILMTGWQGLNRALDMGFRPGEQWVIGAQEHNWKTGFSLSIFKQVAIWNDAVCLRNKDKKPALVRFSFEDALTSNMQFLYKSLYENETGELLTNIEATADEVAKYVYEKLTARGWNIFLYEVNPSMWTYKDICNEIIKLEAQGYEVRLCALDYLLKIPTTGCDQGPAGVDIRNMYERIKAFMASRGITMITPHQLSPDIKSKVREGSANLVKDLVGGGYYSGTKQLGQVIDGELFINIEKDSKGNAYLAIQRGKHRKIQQTPLEHLYFVLKFVAGGIIPDDIDKPDTTRLKVGGEMISVVNDTSFADFGI
jgi:hypothetical protein